MDELGIRRPEFDLAELGGYEKVNLGHLIGSGSRRVRVFWAVVEPPEKFFGIHATFLRNASLFCSNFQPLIKSPKYLGTRTKALVFLGQGQALVECLFHTQFSIKIYYFKQLNPAPVEEEDTVDEMDNAQLQNALMDFYYKFDAYDARWGAGVDAEDGPETVLRWRGEDEDARVSGESAEGEEKESENSA